MRSILVIITHLIIVINNYLMVLVVILGTPLSVVCNWRSWRDLNSTLLTMNQSR